MDTNTDGNFWVRVAAVVVSIIGGFFAVMKLLKSFLDSKADRDQVERHKKANDEQVAKHHAAILDLYAKNDKVVDLIRDLDGRMTERHIEVIKAIGDIRKR